MKQNRIGAVPLIFVLFGLCSIVEYLEFLFVRTDQTVLADNVGTKIFCIFAAVITLKYTGLRFAEIGFRAKGLLKGVLSGLALGVVTFGISYLVESLLLTAQGRHVSFRFYVTNFALTGASAPASATFAALAVCVAVNIVNVLAEEGLFRGLFLKLGTGRYGFSIANWIQAALFGVWHLVMVVLSVYDGLMTVRAAVIMGIGYVLLAGILGLEWGVCVSVRGTLWVGISEHFFNNFIGNTLHVVTENGTDELQIARIILSNLLSLAIVLIVRRHTRKT